jgi:AcrR family transcriptional regulator
MAVTQQTTNRREQILREAARLFAADGYKGTSIRSIAQACGITEPALYRHFDGKMDLYATAIHWKAAQHDISGFLQRQGSQGNIEAVLTRIAQHILGFLKTDPGLLGLMHNNSVETGPSAAVLFREIRLPYIEFLAAEIQRRMALGELREVDPFLTSRCYVGMVMDCALSVGVWNKLMKYNFVAEDVIRNNVPIYTRGLLVQPESSSHREEGRES